MSYHAGVLRALEVEGGFSAASSDLIVGTSAGSVVGAYLRAGWTTEDFWLLALGTHPRLEPIGSRQGNESVFVPTFSSALDFMRRGLGSAYVMSRSVMRMPLRVPHGLRAAFPGGMFNMEEGRQRFAEELPAEWPSQTPVADSRRHHIGPPRRAAAARARPRRRWPPPCWRRARFPASTSR